MKLVTYLRDEADQLAILVNGLLYNTQDLHPDLPNNMQMFLLMWEEVIDLAMHADAQLKSGQNKSSAIGIP
ncbi:MAG TPA: fumarylacetoacetate hydrolase family protein, partial [Chitinophaga sp.]